MISTITTSSYTTSKRLPFSDEDYEEYDGNKSFSLQMHQNPLKSMKFKHENIIEETSNVRYSHSSSSPRLRITSKLATSTGSVNSMGSNVRVEGFFNFFFPQPEFYIIKILFEQATCLCENLLLRIFLIQ